MTDVTTIETCNDCGLSYRLSLVFPHKCAEWTKGRVEPSHEQPASATVGENAKMYTREARQTIKHVHTCMFCGEEGTKLSGGDEHEQCATQLQFLANRAEELSSLLAGMTTERDGLREVLQDALDYIGTESKGEIQDRIREVLR